MWKAHLPSEPFWMVDIHPPQFQGIHQTNLLRCPQKPEVLVPAKEAVKYPKSSFSRSDALLLSVAKSCSIHKDWKRKSTTTFHTSKW